MFSLSRKPRPLHARPRRTTGWLRTTAAAPKAAEGSVLFLGQFTAYVVLLGVAHTAQSGILKAMANVYAVVIFGLVAFAWATREHPPSRWATALVACGMVYAAGIACSIAVNPSDIMWGDLVKASLGPGFLVFGAAFERARAAAGSPPLWAQKNVRLMFALLVLVPLATWAGQLLQSGFEIDGVRETSIFANRNNAAVYAVTMVGLFTVIHGRPLKSLLLFMVVGVMFGTLGVLLAVVIALALTVARPRELALLALLILAGAAGYIAFPEVGPFKRITPVLDSVRLLFEGRIHLRTVSFGDLVVLLKTQDLSFLFRLKHWADLWFVFSNADAYHWLFGHGVGSSIRLSDLRLVPHNDYIRVGFEFGLVTLAAWLAMFGLVLLRCGRRWETVPLLVVLIYLFSENLTTNYIAMAFFYFSAGALAERIGAVKAHQREAARAERRAGDVPATAPQAVPQPR